jgi:hypothetical protein
MRGIIPTDRPTFFPPSPSPQMNKKYTMVQRLSGAFAGLYGRFKQEVIPPDNVPVVDKAESALQGTIDVTTRLADEFNVPELVGGWVGCFFVIVVICGGAVGGVGGGGGGGGGGGW